MPTRTFAAANTDKSVKKSPRSKTKKKDLETEKVA